MKLDLPMPVVAKIPMWLESDSDGSETVTPSRTPRPARICPTSRSPIDRFRNCEVRVVGPGDLGEVRRGRDRRPEPAVVVDEAERVEADAETRPGRIGPGGSIVRDVRDLGEEDEPLVAVGEFEDVPDKEDGGRGDHDPVGEDRGADQAKTGGIEGHETTLQ